MGKYCILGVLIVNNEKECKLVGILINCDLCFIFDYFIVIKDVMIKENLVIVLVGIMLK